MSAKPDLPHKSFTDSSSSSLFYDVMWAEFQCFMASHSAAGHLIIPFLFAEWSSHQSPAAISRPPFFSSHLAQQQSPRRDWPASPGCSSQPAPPVNQLTLLLLPDSHILPLLIILPGLPHQPIHPGLPHHLFGGWKLGAFSLNTFDFASLQTLFERVVNYDFHQD